MSKSVLHLSTLPISSALSYSLPSSVMGVRLEKKQLDSLNLSGKWKLYQSGTLCGERQSQRKLHIKKVYTYVLFTIILSVPILLLICKLGGLKAEIGICVL